MNSCTDSRKSNRTGVRVGGIKRLREKRESLRSPFPPRTAPATSENVAAEEIATGLSQRGLGRRLGMIDVAIAKAKKTQNAASFAAWTQEKDPEGKAWEFRDGKYHPLPLL